MAKATLINKAGNKVVVEGGSPEAQNYFGQGYVLMGPSGQYESGGYKPTTTSTEPIYGDVSGLNTFIPTPAPSQTEATNQALSSDTYKEQSGFISEQEKLNREGLSAQKEQTQQSYARTREDTLRAFQDALDQINRQAREVGISTRAGSAQRQLYNASGELSGIGQGVAARAIEPLTTQTRKLAESQGIALSRLTEDEAAQLSAIDRQIAALPLATKQQQAQIRDQLVQGIFDSAKARQEQELSVFNANRELQNQLRDDQRAADKLLMETPGTRENQLVVRQEQEAKGRRYVSTPAERDALIAAGLDLITIGNDVFTLSAQEQAALDKSRIDAAKALSGDNTSSKYKAKSQSYVDPVTGNRVNSGIAFTDPQGLPISAYEYAQKTNNTLYNVLRGSGDTGDQALIQLWDEARAVGDSDEQILNDIYNSGLYDHLF